MQKFDITTRTKKNPHKMKWSSHSCMLIMWIIGLIHFINWKYNFCTSHRKIIVQNDYLVIYSTLYSENRSVEFILKH
jgi:hypothetical protein